MDVTDLSPIQARQLLDQGSGALYLDVRTIEEFVEGHPPSAFNVPIAEINRTTGGMELNPDFLRIVQSKFPKDSKLIVGCKSGGRSSHAAEMLRAVGYTNVVNMAGGFSGVPGPGYQIVEPGWTTLGYPIETGDAGERSYQSLTKAGG